MAGRNIYLEPIIENAVAGIPVMVQEMGVMVAEMQQSTRILSNILVNTGLTQIQKAFSGADLSAETLNTNTQDYVAGIVTLNNGVLRSASEIACAVTRTETTVLTFNVTGISNLKVSYRNGGPYEGIYCKLVGDGVEIATGAYEDTAPHTFDVNVSDYSIVEIKVAATNTLSATNIFISDWKLDDKQIKINAKYNLKFDSNYIVVNPPTAFTDGVFDNTYGYIDFTGSITGASLWSSVIINGNLTGVKMSIIDSTTLEKIMDLPASINDISTLTQLTNFSIKFEFGEGSEDSYISAVIFRYY